MSDDCKRLQTADRGLAQRSRRYGCGCRSGRRWLEWKMRAIESPAVQTCSEITHALRTIAGVAPRDGGARITVADEPMTSRDCGHERGRGPRERVSSTAAARRLPPVQASRLGACALARSALDGAACRRFDPSWPAVHRRVASNGADLRLSFPRDDSHARARSRSMRCNRMVRSGQSSPSVALEASVSSTPCLPSRSPRSLSAHPSRRSSLAMSRRYRAWSRT